jgi:hypothetical protein
VLQRAPGSVEDAEVADQRLEGARVAGGRDHGVGGDPCSVREDDGARLERGHGRDDLDAP